MKKKPSAKSSRAYVLVPLAALSLFGCASIIGLDEYTVAKGGAGAASGGGAGKAGSTGAAGESGAQGESGALGVGGAAGATPGGNEGGDAGSAPVPVPEIVGCDGKTEFQPNAQIVRSCLLRAGCDPTFDNPLRTISTCVTYNTQDALPGERCNLTSTTCKDYEECEHVGIAHDDLCGGTTATGTRCQGDLAINCGNYSGDDRFFDCAALGGTCAEQTTSSGTLYTDCKLDVSPDSCAGNETTDELHFCHSGGGVSDDLRYYCWEGEAFGSSCSSLATCIDTPDDSDPSAPATGNASCFFDLDSCSGGDSVKCNNNVATLCSKGSQFKYNCGAVGLTCAITAGYEYCLAPGCKAADVDSKCEESCSDDGTHLTFCYGGAPITVDCTEYGFTQCVSDTDDDGNPFAACRN